MLNKVKINVKVPVEFAFKYTSAPNNFEKICKIYSFGGKYKFLDSPYLGYSKLEEGMQFKLEMNENNFTIIMNCRTEEVIENQKITYRYLCLDFKSKKEDIENDFDEEEIKRNIIGTLNKKPMEMDWIFGKVNSMETIMIQEYRISGFFQKLYFWIGLLKDRRKIKKEFFVLKTHIEDEYKLYQNK